MMFLDPGYVIMVMVPGLVIGGLASWITKSTFTKYAKVGVRSGLTGAEAARRMLDREGLQNVTIEPVRGFLSDHYDPRKRTLRLSPKVYNGQSLSSVGVACHEAGHALQHAEQYTPLQLRSAMVPATQFGTNAAYFLLIGGMLLGLGGLIELGAILFGIAVVFSIVTLPVEWDASARAKALMVRNGVVTEQELPHAGRVLNAAFLTYVAAVVTSLLTLAYFLMRAGLLGGDE